MIRLKADQALEGRQVRLREPQRHEMEYIRDLWADPLTMHEVGGPLEFSAEMMEQWFARKVDPGSEQDCYCLILVDDQPVGEVSFGRLDRETRTAELNVKVEAQHRRSGYATDALETFCRFFFEAGGERLIDRIARDNLKGQQALVRFGFEHDHSDAEVFLVNMTRKRFQTLYGKNGNE